MNRRNNSAKYILCLACYLIVFENGVFSRKLLSIFQILIEKKNQHDALVLCSLSQIIFTGDRKCYIFCAYQHRACTSQRNEFLDTFSVPIINWWKGKPSGSIACTRKQQPRFYWNCSSVQNHIPKTSDIGNNLCWTSEVIAALDNYWCLWFQCSKRAYIDFISEYFNDLEFALFIFAGISRSSI